MIELEISISPHVVEELALLLPPMPPYQRRLQVDPLVQDTIYQAKLFLEQFAPFPFLLQEPVHEFIGIHAVDTSHRYNEAQSKKFALVYRPPNLGIFSLGEVQFDENYPVRKVIVESHLPIYSNPDVPSHVFNR